jgi:hypothetical protein
MPRHIRKIADRDIPVALAIARVDQCVPPSGAPALATKDSMNWACSAFRTRVGTCSGAVGQASDTVGDLPSAPGEPAAQSRSTVSVSVSFPPVHQRPRRAAGFAFALAAYGRDLGRTGSNRLGKRVGDTGLPGRGYYSQSGAVTNLVLSISWERGGSDDARVGALRRGDRGCD